MATDPIYQLHMTIMHQKIFDFHHVEGYKDPLTWAREKWGLKIYTNF